MNQGVAMNRDVELIAVLQEYYRQVEGIKEDAIYLARGLSEPQFNWRPSPEKWSIGECLEHLNVTARLYWPIIAASVVWRPFADLFSARRPSPARQPVR